MEVVIEEAGPESPLIEQIYDEIDALDPETAERRAGGILYGLGFSEAMQNTPTKGLP